MSKKSKRAKKSKKVQSAENAKASPTAYDDSFRTLLNDCRDLIIPVVNEVFNEKYTGNEEVTFGVNEQIQSQNGDDLKKVIADSSFTITSSGGIQKRYHLECQALPDSSILVRIFEYDARIALAESTVRDNLLVVDFPKSAIIFLRHRETTPDTMKIRIVTPGGHVEYTVHTIKVKQYTLTDIFDKKLYFFIPFYIFNHENQLEACENDKEKYEQLMSEYDSIMSKLNELQNSGYINEFEIKAICVTTNHVMALIARKYKKVRKGVGEIMNGRVLEYEAKTILNKGINIGRNKGRSEGINIGRSEGINIGRSEGINIGRNEGISIGRSEERKLALKEVEERAKDMLRDRMEISLVEKYTRLSLPRIKELARGLGI